MGSFTKLKKFFSGQDNFLVVCHERPDGDSVGSLLALGEVLEGMGKKVTLVSKDPIPAIFNFLPGADKIERDFLLGGYEVIILVDNGDFHRTGFADRLGDCHKRRLLLINIDHHPKNDLWKMASVNYVDTGASSTCEMLFKLFEGLEVKITPTVATALLTGIFTDTGGFKHSNTSKAVLEITSKLLSCGAKLRAVSANISNSRSVSMLKLWGIALSRLCFNNDIGLVYSVLTKEDIASVAADEDEVSGLVNLINSIPNSKVALLLYETADGKIKGSLRTESDHIDLSKLANLFGGGGHKKASGFTIAGSLEEVQGVWQAV